MNIAVTKFPRVFRASLLLSTLQNHAERLYRPFSPWEIRSLYRMQTPPATESLLKPWDLALPYQEKKPLSFCFTVACSTQVP